MKTAIELLTFSFIIKISALLSAQDNKNLSYPDTGAGDTNRPTFYNRYDKK
jgi:hypothetical protein